MSGYFEALMQASGIATQMPVNVRKGPVPDLGEPAEQNSDAARQPATPPRPLPPATPEPAQAPRAPHGPDVRTAAARPPLPQPDLAPRTVPAQPSGRPRPEAAPGLTAPPPGPRFPGQMHPLARAALDWVAQDNRPPVPKDAAAPPPAAPARLPLQAGAEPVRAARLAAPPPKAPEDPDTRPGAAAKAAAPAPREERVEVTIGAIHLRVEALPALTVAPTAPPAPAAGPAPPPSGPRTSLARRSLRRI